MRMDDENYGGGLWAALFGFGILELLGVEGLEVAQGALGGGALGDAVAASHTGEATLVLDVDGDANFASSDDALEFAAKGQRGGSMLGANGGHTRIAPVPVPSPTARESAIWADYCSIHGSCPS